MSSASSWIECTISGLASRALRVTPLRYSVASATGCRRSTGCAPRSSSTSSRRELGDLARDAGKALGDMLAQLVGDLDVPASDLDSHGLFSFASLSHESYAAPQPGPSARAKTAALSSQPPAPRSAAAQDASVAPVVSTSSTRITRRGAGPTACTRGGRARRSLRRRPTWRGPEARRSGCAASSPTLRASAAAISAAASKPRRRSRVRRRRDGDDDRAGRRPNRVGHGRRGQLREPEPGAELELGDELAGDAFVRRGPADRADAGEHAGAAAEAGERRGATAADRVERPARGGADPAARRRQERDRKLRRLDRPHRPIVTGPGARVARENARERANLLSSARR